METIDPELKPVSDTGSAYVQLGKQTIFGCHIFPKAISEKLGERIIENVCDFILYDQSSADEATIRGKKWKQLRPHAMKPNFRNYNWFVSTPSNLKIFLRLFHSTINKLTYCINFRKPALLRSKTS